MALIFEDGPSRYIAEHGFIRWRGMDGSEQVECRITDRDWGASGTEEAELLRAFNKNRKVIGEIAISKYTLGYVTSEQYLPEQTRTVIIIDYVGS